MLKKYQKFSGWRHSEEVLEDIRKNLEKLFKPYFWGKNKELLEKILEEFLRNFD